MYRNLVLRTSLKSDVFVRAVEFKTGGAPIHHAVIRVDRTSASRRRDGEDGQPGFDGMAWQSVQDPDGHFIGWAPGRGPIVAPDGMPWRLDRGADLVVEVHVHAAGNAARDSADSRLVLHRTRRRCRRRSACKMGSKLIDIPAGERDYVVTDTYELPVAGRSAERVSARALSRQGDAGHRDAAGRRASSRCSTSSNGAFTGSRTIATRTPVPLPRGTRLTMRYTYDNSEENVANPNHPPVARAGRAAVDRRDGGARAAGHAEVAGGCRAARAQSFEEREMLANVALAEARVREAPDVAEYQALLGGSYVEAGRFADAIPHLEAALRLKDQSASTYNYLGVALMAQGRAADALAHFQRAAALDPARRRHPLQSWQRARCAVAVRRSRGGLRTIAGDQPGLSGRARQSRRAAVSRDRHRGGPAALPTGRRTQPRLRTPRDQSRQCVGHGRPPRGGHAACPAGAPTGTWLRTGARHTQASTAGRRPVRHVARSATAPLQARPMTALVPGNNELLVAIDRAYSRHEPLHPRHGSH